jgi:hypothetical protein
LVVFVLVLLSDVLGVEVLLLSPTVSVGDGAGPRFCEPLPPSPPRFRGIALITLDEFGPVSHGQDWKGWERTGEKGLIISDNQAETCLIILA